MDCGTGARHGAYANRYALADHYFSSILGPSFPAHLALTQGSTNHVIDNPSKEASRQTSAHWGCDAGPRVTVRAFINAAVRRVRPCFNSRTRGPGFLVLLRAPGGPERLRVVGVRRHQAHSLPAYWWRNVLPPANFASDVKNGTLASINWVVPPFAVSEHPASSECQGENWTVDQVNAIMNSPYWWNTVIILTWDDFGGFYDDVPPPQENPYQ